MIHTVRIRNFTAFTRLNLQCSGGINLFLGANGAGKSHLLKLLYILCAANTGAHLKTEAATVRYLSEKLKGVFKPEVRIGRLCRDETQKALVRADLIASPLIEFALDAEMDEAIVIRRHCDDAGRQPPVFIPTKEILSIFEGFSSLYLKREVTIDETYFDLSQALETPRLKTPPEELAALLDTLKAACDGEFLFMKQKKFYYKPVRGKLLEVEFAAEGFRKLGMLQLLLQSGQIQPGVSGPLFWDEPEANLNPAIIKQVALILLELARRGQQIFLATHDYFLLKWLDLLKHPQDAVMFHTLFKNNEGRIELNSTDDYLNIQPNYIDDTFAALIDKDIEATMGDLGK